jgi:hypothetical protein
MDAVRADAELCHCGHPRAEHSQDGKQCEHPMPTAPDGGWDFCGCRMFWVPEPPEPVTVRPLTKRECGALRSMLGARVAVARKRAALSQRGLAKVLNRSPSWVREVEAGSQYAPPYLLAALAEATGWTMDWFYGGRGGPRD